MSSKKSSNSTAIKSVNSISEKTGIDRATIQRRCTKAGIDLKSKPKLSDVLDAIKPQTKEDSSIKEKKTYEEWRKLKIKNDKDEGKLQDAAKESEWLGAVLSDALQELEQKLTNELPALVEGLDAPQIRIKAKKIYDQIREKLNPLGKRYADKMKGETNGINV